MNASWYAQRAHMIIERHGGQRQERTIVALQGGMPVLVTSRFDGQFLRDVRYEVLPARLAGPLSGLSDLREIWLDKIGHEPPRRQHNIMVAMDRLDRLSCALKGRAIACTGSRYVITAIVSLIIGVVQKIANHHTEIEGYHVDGIVEDASHRIHDLLSSARCGLALAV